MFLRRLVYSALVLLVSLCLASVGVAQSSPTISYTTPVNGPVGTSVRIVGSNFGASQGSSTVTFNGTMATPTSWSNTQVVAPVPSGATTGPVVVTVGGVASNKVNFTVGTPPTISYTNPVNGPVGTSVTVVGNYFGATQGSSTITFNGTAATPTSWSNTQVVAPVPSGATTGPVIVTVGGVASNRVNFTVGTPPTISHTNPVNGPVGTSVTIVGNYFGASQGSSTIAFNGTAATPTSWSNTRVVAPVPSGATTGPVVVTVGGVVSNRVNFTVGTPPTISYINPVDGPVGTSVTIVGNYFGATPGTVTFNGISASPTSWANTQISVAVPSGASSGPVLVTAGGITSNSVNFIVGTPPMISYTNPIDGPVGTSIAIVGNYFGATQAGSTVSFNGIVASPTSWSNTQIGVPVPSGASTGPLVVNVAGMASNSVNFIVGTPPTISYANPVSAPVGRSITVVGNYFGASQGNSTITFNGIAAVPTSWSNTQVVVAVPDGASTGPLLVTVGGMVGNSVNFTVPPNITNVNPASGPVGTSITITGTSFGLAQGTSTVSFNGTVATPTSWSSTTIVAPVPTGATTGNVVVTVSGVSSAGAGFTVPTLDLLSLSPPAASLANGTTRQFTLIGTYSDASKLNVGSIATWSSSTPAVATVSATGVVTAAGVGQTTIQVTINGLNASATLGVVGQTSTGSLPTAMGGNTLTVLEDSTVLVAGGYNSNGQSLNIAEIYNSATGSFVPTGSLNVARSLHTATLLNNGTVLIVGGDASGTAEIYNPTTNTFTPTGSMNVARSSHTATMLPSGQVLIAGGADSNGNALGSAELYDPTTGTFAFTGNLNSARQVSTATLLPDGTVLIAGGLDNSSNILQSAELYSPSTGAFTAAGNMVAPRVIFSATLLNNGLVLICGGYDASFTAQASAELYNPATRIFASTGSMSAVRSFFTATLLNNGTVLVAGGFDGSGIVLGSAELYDPVSATFVPTANFVTSRYADTTVLLANGNVLEVGGNDSNYDLLASAELYQPSTLAPAGLTSIAVNPANPTSPVGGVQTFAATGTFSDNSTQTLVSANWSSSNNAVASISNDITNRGTAIAIGPVTSTISACTGSICGSATFTASGSALVSIALTPQNIAMPLGTTQQFSATGTYSDGSIQDLTSIATWTSSSSSTTVNSSGLVTAASPGTSTIQVSLNSVTASTNVTVGPPTLVALTLNPSTATIPVGATQQYVVIGTFTDGSTSNVTSSVSWFVVPSETVSMSTLGLATGLGEGTATITAVNGALVAVGNMVVQPPLPPTLVALVVTPAQASIPVGSGQQFIATGNYSDGSTQDLTASVTWTSANTGIASVNTFGFVTAAAQGNSTISAASGSVSGNATVSVTGSTLALNTSRYQHSATLLNSGSVLIAGGINCPAAGSCNYLNSAELYNPSSGTITYTGAMSAARSAPAILLGNGKVLVAGGYSCDTNGNCSSLSSAEIFDPNSNSFSSAGNMTGDRYGHTMTLLGNGKVLIAGGETCSSSASCSALNTAELYDPTAGTFVATGALNNARFNASAAMLSSGKVLIVGGFNGSTYPATAELYDPVAGSFSLTGALNTPRANATATWLEASGDMVLIAGGSTCDGPGCPIASVEYYQNGYFTFLSNMSLPRLNQTATVLTNGQVFFAGGFDSCVLSCVSDTTTELYSPQTYSFVSSQALTTGRSGHTATLLTDGSVLVVGGISNGITLTSTDSYQPPSLALPQLTSIAISPSSSPMAVGSMLQLVATGNSGNFGALQPVIWTSSSPSVASVSNAAGSAGIVNALSIGATTITASVGTISATAQITVTPVLISITLTPLNPSIALNSNQLLQLTATGNYADGSSINLTPLANWTNSTTSVATLTPDVLHTASQRGVIPVGIGTATFTAAFGGLAGSTTVSVLAPPTPIAPSIVSVSPTSGSASTLVTITGSGFGATQGTGTVWLGTTFGTVMSWNDGQVIASVNTGSSSGSVQILRSGVVSNAVPFTVNTATISNVTPTNGIPGTQISITGTGFGAAQGNGSVLLGNAPGLVTSWSDGQVVAIVAPGAASGTAQILQNGVWSNSVPFTINLPHIASISPNSGAAGTLVTISGNGFGATQGSGVVWLGNMPAVVTSWSDTQVAANVASSALSGVAKVQQNGTWSNAMTFTVPLNGGNTNSVTLVPNVFTMQVGGTHAIQALDASGKSVKGLTWTSSNTSVATLSTDDPPVITAVGTGNATITAGSASADVTVLGSLVIPPGTVLWSSPGDGSGVTSIIPAVPSPTGIADVFALQADGTVQAITLDGVVAWTANVGTNTTLIPDFQGGLVVAGYNSVYKLDGITGQASPAYTASSGSWLATPVPHTDGTVFTVDGDKVVGINPQTGQPKFSVQMEDSATYDNTVWGGGDCYSSPLPQGTGSGAPGSRPPSVGNLIIAGDGYAYVPYSFSITTSNWVTMIPNPENLLCSEVGSGNTSLNMRLLRVGTQGDSYEFPLGEWSSGWSFAYGSTSQSAPLPNISWTTPITNADTGVLFGWSVDTSGSAPPCPPGTQFGSGCVFPNTTFNLMTTSSTGVVSQATLNIPGGYLQPVLQRADGSYVGTDGTNMYAFNLSGQLLWTVPNDYPQIATSDGGVIGASGITYDQNGNANGLLASLPTYSWLGHAYQMGSVEEEIANGLLLASSWWAFASGNASGNSTAVNQAPYAQLISCNDKTLNPPPSCPQPKDAAFNAWWYLQQRMADSPVRIYDLDYYVFNPPNRSTAYDRKKFLAYLGQGAGPEFYDGTQSTVKFPDAQCAGNPGWSVLYFFSVQNNALRCDSAAVTCRLGSTLPLRTFFEPNAISYDSGGATDGNIAMEFHEALHGFTGMDDPHLQAFLGCTVTDPILGSTYNITLYLQQFVGQQPPQPQPGLPNQGIKTCKDLEKQIPDQPNLCVRPKK